MKVKPYISSIDLSFKIKVPQHCFKTLTHATKLQHNKIKTLFRRHNHKHETDAV
ncbi:hypothetical protein HanPI659440_Chr10g0387021 [Helianthus annuus]|nr:hypothetical protein HanPI659440_Chr10g0387021 [Helianthus annuus]